MARPARKISEEETLKLGGIDELLTMAEGTLAGAIDHIRELRYDGVPIQVIADKTGLTVGAVRGIGISDPTRTEYGPMVAALTSLKIGRWNGQQRKRMNRDHTIRPSTDTTAEDL